VQFIDQTAVQSADVDPRADAMKTQMSALEHCPDFNERFTLADGKTKGVPYPEIGFNCNPDFTLSQKKQSLSQEPNHGPAVASLEHCPDFDERFTLADGRTKAVAYPAIGYNCNADY